MYNNIMTTATNCLTGYLEIIIGPMFSSKTTTILEIYKKCKFCNIPVVIINHSLDKRYDDKLIVSHDKINAPCIQTKLLNDVWNKTDFESYNMLRNSEVILINEGQFFEDLFTIVTDMLDKNKKVYIAGLDGDFERNKFGSILDLIPICDKVTKLTSLCAICKDGTPGIFSMRLTTETEQTIIGSDNYIPVCRKCYNDKHISIV